MIKMKFEGEGEKNMERVFMQAFKNAFTKSVEFIFAKCYVYAPVGKTKKGPVNLRNALRWDFDWSKWEAQIGIPSGSEMEKIAFYVEMGTGERGDKGWKQWFDESKPTFTIPIVPTKAKAMHFVNESGQDVFIKKSKGQSPQSFMRRAFWDSKEPVDKIWKGEFSDENIRQMLKIEKF